MKCKFILNDTLNSVKVLFRHLVASLTDGHLVIRSCFHCVAQVFYLSDTEAQFDNFEVRDCPNGSGKIATKAFCFVFCFVFYSFFNFRHSDWILFQHPSFHSMKPPEV